MAINPNSQITYGDLYDSIVQSIKSKCANVGSSWSSAVPPNLRSGHSASFTTGSLTVRESLSDGNLTLVPVSTVQSQLDSFLMSRGLYTKRDQVMTLKGIISFYNNVAAFLLARVKVAAGDSVRVNGSIGQCTYYLSSSGISYMSIPYADTQSWSVGEPQASVTNLYSAISNTGKLYFARYSYSFTSSCCSSSSCSSSSSSSSSCSMFVAYMKL